MNRDQNNYYSVILDSITDGVFTVDRDWKITSFNRAAAARELGIRRTTLYRRMRSLGLKPPPARKGN